MKVLADSNILVSALFYPNSKPAAALIHAAENHDLVVTEYNLSELRQIAREKFPNRQMDVEVFLSSLSYELIQESESTQQLISDPKDAPILNAAIAADVDVIISGDKHFLALDMTHPQVLKAADYLEHFGKRVA